MDNVVASENPYSRILWWEVWNFMSIEHGKAEFDERNIINFKGYNDSGKSAMLNALKVALTNSNPTKQVGFIQDDKEYFRILIAFDDGVQILRDKYINGQSLYEMYKDGQCIFSTKKGSALVKVSEVPEPIADYLGLILYDGVCLNARSCFEKQIGVQTTGKENYSMFNTVLKSEEIFRAGELLNSDRNSLSSDIDATDYELQAQKQLLGDSMNLTADMIEYLKEHDSSLDTLITQETLLEQINNIIYTISTIPVVPEVNGVDTSQLDELDAIANLCRQVDNITITPEVDCIADGVQLDDLSSIISIADSLANIVVVPELDSVDTEQLNALDIIQTIVNNLAECDVVIQKDTESIEKISKELDELQKELSMHGVKMVKCPSCGQIFSPDEEHVDQEDSYEE